MADVNRVNVLREGPSHSSADHLLLAARVSDIGEKNLLESHANARHASAEADHVLGAVERNNMEDRLLIVGGQREQAVLARETAKDIACSEGRVDRDVVAAKGKICKEIAEDKFAIAKEIASKQAKLSKEVADSKGDVEKELVALKCSLKSQVLKSEKQAAENLSSLKFQLSEDKAVLAREIAESKASIQLKSLKQFSALQRQMEECCCSTKALINSTAVATQTLVNDIATRQLRDQLAAANAEVQLLKIKSTTVSS